MSGLFQAVADNAIDQAEELEQEAETLRAKAAENDRRANGLRQMHAIAAQFAKQHTTLLLKETAA